MDARRTGLWQCRRAQLGLALLTYGILTMTSGQSDVLGIEYTCCKLTSCIVRIMVPRHILAHG